jgi:hypothetical protein
VFSILVIAHAGHWIATIIELTPLIAVVTWLVIVTTRDRRKERREAKKGGGGGDQKNT